MRFYKKVIAQDGMELFLHFTKDNKIAVYTCDGYHLFTGTIQEVKEMYNHVDCEIQDFDSLHERISKGL